METLAYLHLTAVHGQPVERSLQSPTQAAEDGDRRSDRSRSQGSSLSMALGVGLVGMTTLLPLSAQAQATLTRGSSGDTVVQLQQQLANLGYFNSGTTGFYGDLTQEAVSQFQRDYGIQVDGVAGPQTLAALLGGGSPAPAAAPVATSGTRSDSVTAGLQSDLATLGYYQGGIDGIYGPLTEQAVRTFQANNGLTVDGIVGVRMLSSIEQAVAGSGSSSSDQTSSSRSSNTIAVTPATSTLLASTPRTGQQDDSRVVVQNGADGILVNQGSGTGSIVVQQHPERTIVETIPSTSVVVSQPNATANTTVGNGSFSAPPTATPAGTPYPYAPAVNPGQPLGTAYSAYPPALPPGYGTTGYGTTGYGTTGYGGTAYGTTGYGGTAYTTPPNYDATYYPYVVAIPHRTNDDLMMAMRFSPGAFVAGSQRGAYINAGSYASRAEADTLTQALRQQGLDARVIFRPR
ncbi:peptidoglycan-binding domain-containing protein [Prochlorothrix hollandica]|uniref:peptidoglycan-binding domain-containing protein n=1 Tax=Prochlorothrix hollandica TaxID=1223 RepID=UPI003340C1E5